MDIRNAITYVESLPEADPQRIGLWGSSFGGANAIMVSFLDKRIKALVVQLTFGSGERVITGSMKPEERAKLESTLKKIWIRTVTQNKPMMLAQNQVLTDSDSKAFFEKLTAEYPKIAVKIPFMTIRHTMEYKPEDYISKLNIPVFILSADKDIVNPPDESKILFEKAQEPKELKVINNASHYDIYSGEKFKEAFAAELIWFKRYLRKIIFSQ
jgi:fermentation-respiration switch protein FrsA (DUF1100 family)